MYSPISAINGRTSSSAASVADMPIVYVVDDDVFDPRDPLNFLFVPQVSNRCSSPPAVDFLSRWHDDGPSCMVLDVKHAGSASAVSIFNACSPRAATGCRSYSSPVLETCR